MTQVTKPTAKPAKTVTKPVAAKLPAAKAAPESDDDFFDASNSVKLSYFKPETIGDHVKGVLVDKFISDSSLNPGQKEESYILETEDQGRVCIKGRGRRKSDNVKVIFGMEKIPLGAVVGFIYTDDKDTGQPQPAKIIEIRYKGETNQEVLAAYRKKFVTGDTTVSGGAPEAGAADTAVADPALPSFGEDEE